MDILNYIISVKTNGRSELKEGSKNVAQGVKRLAEMFGFECQPIEFLRSSTYDDTYQLLGIGNKDLFDKFIREADKMLMYQ